MPADIHSLMTIAIAATLSALVGALALIACLRRVLPDDFLAAGITERSAHRQPARQIGGLGAVPTAFAVAVAVFWLAGLEPGSLVWPAAGMALLFALGFADDLLSLGPGLKLLVQIVAAAIAVPGLDLSAGWLGALPGPLAFLAATLLLAGFVNLVNFMDGIDLMSLAGAGTGILFLGATLLVCGNPAAGLAGLVLWGAMAGFGWHNRPAARVFLGDSGSLPLGLTAGFLALSAAGTIPLPAAVLPFGYYLVDGVATFVMRLRAGENVTRAHARHAYQHARRKGLPVWRIAGEVAAVSALGGAAALAHAAGFSPLAWTVTLVGWAAAAGLYLRYRRTGQSNP